MIGTLITINNNRYFPKIGEWNLSLLCGGCCTQLFVVNMLQFQANTLDLHYSSYSHVCDTATEHT